MPALRATSRPLRLPDKGTYQCPRCGGFRSCHASRPIPAMCRDCTEAVRELEALERDIAAGQLDLDQDQDDYSDLRPVQLMSHRAAYV